MKRKSLTRLKSELWNKLRPEVNLATLANEIAELVYKHVGKSARTVNLPNNLAAYLTQKYAVSNRKTGELRWLIECHSDDLAAFLDRISFREIGSLLKKADQLPQTKKKTRVKARTEAEAAQRRKKAKNRYEENRRGYREGLIIEQFGKFPRSWPLVSSPLFSPLVSHSKMPPVAPCLDILFSGGAITMAGHVDSFENLFGVDRHRFPQSLPRKRSGRNVVYYLDAFIECLIHLLANRDGREQWLPEPRQRDLVLRGIIERAYRYSPEIGDMLAEKLRSYLR